jgi:outer membrane protein OmpA-like peptidoglycan-associated protein
VWAALSTQVPALTAAATSCSEVAPVWKEYFAASSSPFAFASSSSCVVKGAKTDPEGSETAKRAAAGLTQDIIDNLPITLRGVTPSPFSPDGKIAELRVPLAVAIGQRGQIDLHPNIVYNNAFNAAANLAGGVGKNGQGSDIFGDDDREMSGTVIIDVIRIDPSGAMVGQVRWQPHVHVKDTVDFCPGNLGNSFQRDITIPLSKLEAQHLTRDVPITIDYDLDQIQSQNFSVFPLVGPIPDPKPKPGPQRPRHVVVPATALFEFGKDQLLPGAADALLKSLGDAPSKADLSQPFVVVGHTDSKGSPDFNQGLSERRAASATRLLEEKFPNLAGRIKPQGRGANDPVAPNSIGGLDNPDGRRQNRRVEISFTENLD